MSPALIWMTIKKIKKFKKETGITIKSKETKVTKYCNTTKSKETSTALHSYS